MFAKRLHVWDNSNVTTIAIYPDRSSVEPRYRAVAGDHEAVGKSAGEALDAVTAQLSDTESGALLVVRPAPTDAFFPEDRRARLEELMNDWRSARDSGVSLLPANQAELNQLVSEELEAARRRAAALLGRKTP